MADQSKHQEITLRILRDWEQAEYARDNGARDLIFARRTQWDDELDSNVDTEYRGQFDIVKPERRRILASLMKNEFNNRFRPKDEDHEGIAEVLQDYYRATVRTNDARMAGEIAISEAIDCGVGAWRLEVVDEDDEDPLNTDKKIVRGIIHEANNKVVWDSNAKKIDKSDAKTCTIVFSLGGDAYEELMAEHGLGATESQFELPDYLSRSTLCWRQAENYTIAEFYQIKERKQKITIMSNGEDRKAMTTGELRKGIDWLSENGYEREAVKTVIKRDVWKTVLTGAHILSRQKIAGKHIPVIPVYGEWSFNQDTENWEGLVRMLRDPQQMRNTTMSYIFDLLAKGPIEKDIYAQEQIDGYEPMYEEQNNYKHPYYLQNLYDENGNQLPLGPLGKKGGPSVPAAAQFLLSAADQAVAKSVGGGITPDQMINPQVTDDQLRMIQETLDIQSQLYKEHLEYAYRREGQIFASIISEISDTEKTISVMSIEGKESKVTVNKVTSNIQDMSMTVENDMTNADMEVFTDVTPTFATQNDKIRNEMLALMEKPIDPQDLKLAQWTYIQSLEGPAYEPMRRNARKSMVLGGYFEEKDLTEEEELMVEQQAQQPKEPPVDPAMMLAAEAEMEKAQNGKQVNANKTMEIQGNHQIKMEQIQLDKQRVQLDIMIFQREKDDKYNVDAANIGQNQQKIDMDQLNKDREFGLALTTLEVEHNRDLNAEVQSNMMEYDPQTGSIA